MVKAVSVLAFAICKWYELQYKMHEKLEMLKKKFVI